jgi:ketosteroid isomerase-like protein
MRTAQPTGADAGRRADHEAAAETRIAFLSALRRGDTRRAVAYLARDACFVTPDATVVRGRPDVAAILAQLTATGMELEAEPLVPALIAGDTALCPERWTAISAGEGGESLVRTFVSRSVMVRIEEDWKLLILAPWGGG